jgi:hypothetical protein
VRAADGPGQRDVAPRVQPVGVVAAQRARDVVDLGCVPQYRVDFAAQPAHGVDVEPRGGSREFADDGGDMVTTGFGDQASFEIELNEQVPRLGEAE